MVKRCAYGVCNSDSRYPHRLSGGVVFFPFPKPKTQLDRCLQWIQRCGRPHAQLNVSTITKHTYVCSKHFVNGKPTYKFPDPVSATRSCSSEDLERNRKPHRKQLRVPQEDIGSASSTDEADELATDRPDSSSDECQVEKEPEGTLFRQDAENEKKIKEIDYKMQLSSQESEIESLKAQIITLKSNALTPEILQSSKIHRMLEYSTGFTYEQFNQLCTIFDMPTEPSIPLNSKHDDWHIPDMPVRSQLLLVLMKLRHNEDLKSLAFRFNVTMQIASSIFNTWLHYMFRLLSELPIWPHRDVIAQNMPDTYKEHFPTTFAILDCTELKVERPSSLALQNQSSSHCKSTNTLKAVVACDPRGAVIFTSALFSGSLSDKEIVRQCGIIALLKKLIDGGFLKRGDGIMADEGYFVEEDMQALGLKLHSSPFSMSKSQKTAEDVQATKRVVKHRLHVDRTIAKIKKFKIVSDIIPSSRLGIMNHIWYVVSMLSNFQSHILK